MTLSTSLVASAAVVAVVIGMISGALPYSGDPMVSEAEAPASITINGGDSYSSLAAAVVAAKDGDTIELGPGTYTESVVIDKDITLTGNGEAEDIVVSVDDGPVMTIQDAEATLSGLTFTGPDSDGLKVNGGAVVLEDLVFERVGVPFTSFPCPVPCYSLDIRDGASAVVRDNDLVGGGEIIVDGGSTVEIEGNRLADGPHIALFDLGPGSVVRNNTISSSSLRGIGLYEPTDIVVSGNTITDIPVAGIIVGWSSGGEGIVPEIVANTISGTASGIDVARSAKPFIERNVLFDNGAAIVIRGSDAAVSANDLSGNGQGIVVMSGSPHIAQNTVTSGSIGLTLSSRATPVLSENTVCDNDTNVSLTGDAEMPDTTGNEICPD